MIEKIVLNDTTSKVNYDIKFRDDRKITANEDNILSKDETDVSILPNDAKDCVHTARCLTAEEIKTIKEPPVLSNLEQEWKSIHNQYGHLPFTSIDKLVTNNILPSKFKVLQGKKFMCPSFMLGKMWK